MGLIEYQAMPSFRDVAHSGWLCTFTLCTGTFLYARYSLLLISKKFCDITIDVPVFYTLQRQNAENLKQIFPEKEYRGLSHNFHIHVSVSELYIPTVGLPFLLEEICGPILRIYKSLTGT
jgi:hypothetical protein